MTPDHEWVLDFSDGEVVYERLVCHLAGAERPCAVIDCPVDHEDVTRDCIAEHGAVAQDECWAVSWSENGGRESVDTSSLPNVRIPVRVEWDEGVALSLDTTGTDGARLQEIERCARGVVRTAHPNVCDHGVVRQWWDALKAALNQDGAA